jgi:acetylornithine deacetylase/succinyl-diaminopimelate desuccinylase-like protein
MKNNELEAYLDTNADQQLQDLCEWLRIPSISTLYAHRDDVQQAAAWLAEHLRAIGLEHVQVIPGKGHPLVTGDWLHAGTGRPTVLIYGHYDVQPVDPVDKWTTPPFEPTVRGDDLFARGTTDDKGQLLALVKAVQALLAVRGELPVNLKLIVEGEEECGGTTLASYITENRVALTADVCVIADTAILAPDQPSIVYGLRGAWGCELVVRGPSGDLHSGGFGGVVHNPMQALAELIASLHDASGRVTVDGFYDDVVELDQEERDLLRQVPRGPAEIQTEAGVPALYGEPGYTPVERIGTRPTIEINGAWGGFIGDGFKTVIPAEARAKISCRLVPNQDPQQIARVVTDHLQKATPATVTSEVIPLFGGRAVVIDHHGPAIQAAIRAYELGFGATPVLTREGGGIPIVSICQDQLGAEVILMGFGLPDDNAHAPNEKIHLPCFYRGIRNLQRKVNYVCGLRLRVIPHIWHHLSSLATKGVSGRASSTR